MVRPANRLSFYLFLRHLYSLWSLIIFLSKNEKGCACLLEPWFLCMSYSCERIIYSQLWENYYLFRFAQFSYEYFCPCSLQYNDDNLCVHFLYLKPSACSVPTTIAISEVTVIFYFPMLVGIIIINNNVVHWLLSVVVMGLSILLLFFCLKLLVLLYLYYTNYYALLYILLSLIPLLSSIIIYI